MGQSNIQALLVNPNELPQLIKMPNTLRAQQKLVNGHIEVFYLNDDKDACVICNDYGKFDKSCEPNRCLGNDIIHGSFLICGNDMENGDFISLSTEQVEKYKEQFNEDSIKKTQLRINAQKLVQSIFYRKR